VKLVAIGALVAAMFVPEEFVDPSVDGHRVPGHLGGIRACQASLVHGHEQDMDSDSLAVICSAGLVRLEGHNPAAWISHRVVEMAGQQEDVGQSPL
jgi:hypothetical protein